MAGYSFITPRDYGAIGGGNPDTAALQDWIAAVQADRTRCGMLDDNYVTYFPLRINTSNTHIFGASWNCGITMNNCGPALVVAGTESSSLYTSPIRPDGVGNALNFTGDNLSTTIVVSDNPQFGSLDGVTHLMIRGWYKPASTADGYTIIASNGLLTTHDTAHQALLLYNAAGPLAARLCINGTAQIVTAPSPLVAGNTYFFALTYDGTTIRLYQGLGSGTVNLVASKVAAGAITQAAWEGVIVGGNFRDGFGSSQYGSGPNGVLQDLTVEASTTTSVSEYTSASFAAPVNGWGLSGNMRLCLSGRRLDGTTTQSTDMVCPVFCPGEGLLPMYRQQYPASVSGCLLENFAISSQGQGLVAVGHQDGRYRNLKIAGYSHGIVLKNNCYNSRLDDLLINLATSSPRNSAAIMLNHAAWICPVKNLKTAGGGFGIVAIGSTGIWDGGYITGNSIASVLASGGGGGGNFRAVDYALSDENSPYSNMLAWMIFDNAMVSLRHLEVDNNGNDSTPFTIWDDNAPNDTFARATIEGCSFGTRGNPNPPHVYRHSSSRNWIKAKDNIIALNATRGHYADGI